MTYRNLMVSGVAAIALALASAGSANATPMRLTLTATNLTTSAVFASTFTDVSLGTPNVIAIGAGNTGPIFFTGEFASSTVGPPLNILNTSATSISNTSTTDTFLLVAALSGMNFVGPDNQISLTASGTWEGTAGSTFTSQWYNDPTNTLGADCVNPLPNCLPLTTPGNLVGSFTSDPAIGLTSSYAYSPPTGPLAIPDTGLFSMTEFWTYTLAPGGSLVSRGQTELKSFASIPEPSTLLVFGTGLVGFGLMRRRRRT